MKKTLLISFVLLHFLCFSQEKYPQNYFSDPLEIPILLSGSFGELRSNHFHAGLDIKTQSKEGLKVLAAADGYISRIKVQQFGYGKAIYITHPNGFTTVYGHLSKFADKIETHVKSVQYKTESYETGNLTFKKDEFLVQKGEIIALSGDTGGSGGPHLHFEIRNTITENVINPLFFGLKVDDTIAPTFLDLKVYALNTDSRVNQQRKSFQIPLKNIENGIYTSERITASGLIGFGVNVIDRFNNSNNKNGIFSLEMLVNGNRVYYHDVEEFSFAESKYLNLLIDYEHYKKYKKKYQKTYKENASELTIFKDLINNGKIDIKEALNYTIEIIAKDFKGNTSSLKIPVAGAKSNSIFTEQMNTTDYKIIAKNFNKFKIDNVTVAFPKNTFYEDIYLDFKIDNGIAKIHTPTIPLDKSYTLTFDVSSYSEAEKEHLFIANIEYSRYPRYQYTRKKDSTFYTTTKTLGSYTLLSDKVKPTIKLLYFKDQQWLSNSETLKVMISDVGSDIKNYRATIDDEWILMELNHKKNILTYNFSDKKLVGSKHIFKIVVSDNAGNTNELSATFFKKQIN
ncbi:M23 family metallopeptidase [Polaribacter glomeratus]|uniref:Peptidase M23 n=1 Tax=Polaribacter glomeratus TaxID=102 RepID=A0A2S7WVI9_9FLAO|nr:M23 family metallopeptidase [Polaribacter glomeratus]PQJ81614.1 peptidase M23 [Polaribacter glomeratus]TXD66461.1 M23 family metallopeptidase [Polaribacter glomeratus]